MHNSFNDVHAALVRIAKIRFLLFATLGISTLIWWLCAMSFVDLDSFLIKIDILSNPASQLDAGGNPSTWFPPG